MDMIQVIYASRPFGFDDGMLNGILSDARRCNGRDDITGALICRGDLYLQLLEGPRDVVDAAYRRIVADSRHLEVRQLSHRTVTSRLFPTWAMRDDPAQSWMWNQSDVAAGALDTTSPEAARAVFERLAEAVSTDA